MKRKVTVVNGFLPIVRWGQPVPGIAESGLASKESLRETVLAHSRHYALNDSTSETPLLIVSDFHWATYKTLLPSAADLKSRGITKVVVGLENEDQGKRSLDELATLGQPAQRAFAETLKHYQEHGIQVELYGLDPPRGVTPSGKRPFQQSLFYRVLWESGISNSEQVAQLEPRVLGPKVINQFIDQMHAKFADGGRALDAQRERLEQARREALAAAEKSPSAPPINSTK